MENFSLDKAVGHPQAGECVSRSEDTVNIWRSPLWSRGWSRGQPVMSRLAFPSKRVIAG